MTVAALFSTVSSRRVFEGKIAKVRVDEVAMPGGSTAMREVVEHDRAVAVVALDSDRRVVMLTQYRHPLRRRLWELPAGLMDIEDEPPLIAAQRELAEETGFSAAQWSVLVDVASSPGFTDEAVRVFLATDLTAAERQGAIVDEEFDLAVVLIDLDTAVAAALDGRIVNGTAVAGLLAAQHALTSGSVLRDGADPWTTGPALVHQGDGIGEAPALLSPAVAPQSPGA